MSEVDFKNAKDVRPEHVQAYYDLIRGIPVMDVAEKFGKSVKTIYNWKDKVEQSGIRFSRTEVRELLESLITPAYESLKHNLEKKEVRTTIAFWRGLGYFINKDIMTDTEDARKMSPEELEVMLVEGILNSPKAKQMLLEKLGIEPSSESRNSTDNDERVVKIQAN